VLGVGAVMIPATSFGHGWLLMVVSEAGRPRPRFGFAGGLSVYMLGSSKVARDEHAMSRAGTAGRRTRSSAGRLDSLPAPRPIGLTFALSVSTTLPPSRPSKPADFVLLSMSWTVGTAKSPRMFLSANFSQLEIPNWS